MAYLPHTPEDIQSMLDVIGKKHVDDLFAHIPAELRLSKELNIPEAMSEPELTRHLKTLAQKNECGEGWLSFLGGGAYQHLIPAAVTELSMRSEFLTPYTPYQPEIAQGTLQATFEYQTLMCRIFNMEISNASLYDGSTALAEAVLMALRINSKRKTVVICDAIHPEYREVLKTLLPKSLVNLVTLPNQNGCLDRAALKSYLNDDLAAVCVQYPNFFGIVEDFQTLADDVHGVQGLLITATPEPVSLGLLKPPGDFGADIAVGEGLSFGIPMTFGGPGLGIFTTREKYLRQMPGRVCGETVDADGRRSYVLTLSTREQHIRREKATSNICTNQAHCATTSAIHLSMLGKEGLRELAMFNAAKTQYAISQLTSLPGVKRHFAAPVFNECVLEFPKPAHEILKQLRKRNIHAGIDLSRFSPNLANALLVCCTEVQRKEDIDHFVQELRNIL
ncbi:MAG: aminomethyl-transferring glycine dehydrogenase subunit GcvPA [Deltaproteobacteria bacterium]|nr:aminomethyl-transferring glycine dehydrogenase subunit GcvPA [Deltaproteobacteria bacterium]